MHILFLSPHSDPRADLGEQDAGGQCVYEDELATHLAEFGHTVSIFCKDSGSGRPEKEVCMKNYTIYRIDTGEKSFVPKEEIEGDLLEFTRKVSNIVRIITDQTTVPVIIHGHYWDGAKSALMLKHALNAHSLPMVWIPHSLGEEKRQRFPGVKNEVYFNFIPRQAWENYAIFFSERIIVSSALEKKNLMSSYAKVRDNVSVIAPGVAQHKIIQTNAHEKVVHPKKLFCTRKNGRK